MDLTGKVVTTVPAERFSAGANSVKIETSNLSEGVYFVRMSSLESSVSSRLVIMK
jgi:hypothetical protein